MSNLPGVTTSAQNARNMAIVWKCYCVSTIARKCRVCEHNSTPMIEMSDFDPDAPECTCYWEMGQIWGDDPNCPAHSQMPELTDEYNFG
jgi:hypothetical protein